MTVFIGNYQKNRFENEVYIIYLYHHEHNIIFIR
ncbi:hypothetical protein CLV99_4301 [Sphingobacterium yanglingense]|uniref:Uncharacterized protein n=1 Tax=Sphingobacterium yanglingense TaxID=1437280 RepID=A0A4V3DCV1_9SPHI|nr:hypothetical protein CLV99_4301 [Sphingobacterium yanglingense]